MQCRNSDVCVCLFVAGRSHRGFRHDEAEARAQLEADERGRQ